MSGNAIETHGLTVYYGRHRGIMDVNLTVSKGEVFGFLGPNGAGKTTTQRVLLDVFPPTRGSATIFGQDCQSQGVELRKRIGYLPGELALYTNMNVKRILPHVCIPAGRERCEGLLARVGQNDWNSTPAARSDQLSRGNKQKVGVVAAFMSKG